MVGQMLDTGTNELDTFSWARYASIVQHKTSHYSFFLPLVVGFHLADRTPTNQTELRRIAYRIGDLFQAKTAQDDYLDCFGDPAVTGKSNLTDFAERKCTWITCTLIDKLSKDAPDKLAFFREYFGGKSEQHLQLARQIVLDEHIGQEFAHKQAIFEYQGAPNQFILSFRVNGGGNSVGIG
ncbi:hypothetical protein niasHT_030934 [Heterodera trifolii]|uniref:Farnesyl diphosphate synthase n=1 Tax=Heterodera trifolii TaxID=157864 RepID=A0ABD2J8G7_9BILA